MNRDDELVRRVDALDACRYDDAYDCRAAIEALPVGTAPLMVKARARPLVWKQISGWEIKASGVDSVYRIVTAQSGQVRFQFAYMDPWHDAPSIEAAKDAVWMHHVERVSRFVDIEAKPLAPTLADVGAVSEMKALVEALSAALHLEEERK